MAANGFEPDRSNIITMDQVEAARRVIAGYVSDASELVLLLDLLGIGRIIDPGMIVVH